MKICFNISMNYRANILYRIKNKRLYARDRLNDQGKMLFDILKEYGELLRSDFLYLIKERGEGKYKQSPEAILNWWQKKLIDTGIMEKVSL